jgi:hypothetical protein
MNFDELRNWYKRIEWESLKKSEFGEAGDLSPVTNVLERIKRSFEFLLGSLRHKQIPSDLSDLVARHLSDFKQLVGEINAYTDAAKREEMCEKVRVFEYKLQKEFSHVFSYFLIQTEIGKGYAQNNSQLNEKQIVKLIQQHQNTAGLQRQEVLELIHSAMPEEKWKQAQGLVDDLLKERENIKSAIDITKKVIESNESLVKSILETSAADATNKALEHKTFYIDFRENYLVTRIPIVKEFFSLIFWLFPYFNWFSRLPVPKGVYVWLLASLLSGIGVLGIVWFFINSGEEVSLGSAILRVSAIIVPSYFAVLFSRQFLNHKKLYEFYMFKKVASQTMISLRSQFQKGSTADQMVLEKGLNVLFNEPNLGDKNLELDSVLVKDLVELILNRGTN